MALRRYDPVNELEQFKEELGLRLSATVEKQLAVVRRIETEFIPKAAAEQAQKTRELSRAKTDALRLDIETLHEHAKSGGSLEDLDLGPDRVAVVEAKLDEATRKKTAAKKTYEASVRYLGELAADDGKLEKAVENAWNTHVNFILDPSNTTVLAQREAEARRDALVPICHRLIELIDRPHSEEEQRRLRRKFADRPGTLPRLAAVRREITGEAAKRAEKAERIAAQATAFSNFGSTVPVQDRSHQAEAPQ